jgi:hypothetical protein
MLLDIDTRNPRLLRVKFIFDTSHPTGQVSGVGSFNGWTPGLDGLLPEPDGNRRAAVQCPVRQRILFRYLRPGDEWAKPE